MRIILAIAILPILAIVARVAQAQPSGVDRPMDPQAKVHLDRGLSRFFAKDYEAAIVEFRGGYAIDPRAAFLYAWAQAERLSGDCESAITMYKKFLDTHPTERYEQAARENLARCETALATRPEPHDDVPPPPSPAREPERPAAQNPAAPSLTPAPPDTRRGTLKIAGLLTAAAGLIMTGLAVKYALDAREQNDRLATLTQTAQGNMRWTDTELQEAARTVADGDGAEQKMVVLFAVGGGAAALGAVLYYFGAKAQPSRGEPPPGSAMFRPLLGPGTAGAMVVKRF